MNAPHIVRHYHPDPERQLAALRLLLAAPPSPDTPPHEPPEAEADAQPTNAATEGKAAERQPEVHTQR